MKKLLVLFMLFVCCSPAFAEVLAPQWSEFCPNEFLDASQKIDNTMPVWLWNITYYSLVGIPYALVDKNKYKKIKVNNYWVDRRKQFETEVFSCNQITTNNEKTMCYFEIRKLEFHKNDINNGAYNPIIKNYNYNNGAYNYSPQRY